MKHSHPIAIAGAPTIAVITEVVAEYYGITPVAIRSQRRSQDVVGPRHLVCWLAKRLTGKSYPEIGRALGGRDHTTVLHAVEKMEAAVEVDLDLLADIVAIEGVLKGLLARFGDLVSERFPDHNAPDIARRVLARDRGEFTVSLNELRVLVHYAASQADQDDAAPQKSADIGVANELAATVKRAIKAGRELERARFSRDESGAIDQLTKQLKDLGAAWSDHQGEAS